ncbi:MAG: tRNA (adenosine(37)-N6)-threonylcarbamoyltransferase complex ATPase subunit type 1 TsaE [Pseudomonadota bacterium]
MTDRLGEGSRFLENEQATEAAGAAIARAAASLLTSGNLPAALVITLSGDLGAGKTCLARGVMRALGHRGPVKSPTYTLVEPYEHTRIPVCHFDLYRLADPEEVEFLGVDECFEPGRLCLVEWPDRGAGFMPAADLDIRMSPEKAGRRLQWRAVTATGSRLAGLISGQPGVENTAAWK